MGRSMWCMRWHAPWVLLRPLAPRAMDCWRFGKSSPASSIRDRGFRPCGWRGGHAAKEILGVGDFDEDDLYANLDWLAKQQPDIEKVLFEKKGASEGLFLYDVTSTYLEGKRLAFGAFGYSRDGKRGKWQRVVGLLCNAAGIRWPSKFFQEIPKIPRPSTH